VLFGKRDGMEDTVELLNSLAEIENVSVFVSFPQLGIISTNMMWIDFYGR
jgi:hypothetical protein